MHDHCKKPDWPLSRSIGTIDVWTVRLDVRDAQSDHLYETLPAAERERAGRFRFEEPRRQFVVTRASLRRLLGEYLGIPPSEVSFAVEANGKPRLAEACQRGDLRFNVAHTAGLALVAVTAGCEIGVDVEHVRAVNHQDQIAQRYFHPVETAAILSADGRARDEAFMRCWTGKEAVLKAIGSGVGGLLKSFHVPTEAFGQARVDLPAPFFGEHTRCGLHELVPGPSHIGAVACLGEERSVRHFVFEF